MSVLMKLPQIEGVIRRRILINYQVDPAVIEKFLPSNFKPKVYRGKSIIGVCLIRLEEMHPKLIPSSLGITSENAAYRMAVQWNDDNGNLCDGVYIFRRETSSQMNTLLGGRLFPGEYYKADFSIEDNEQQISFRLTSNDPNIFIYFEAKYSDQLPESSVFESVEELSEFIKLGAEGYSPTKGNKSFHGMCLIPHTWNMTPLACSNLELNYFSETFGLSEEDIKFDSMVIMRDIPHEWQSIKTIN